MGSIDCDPATCKFAQQTVGADVYYTAETDGLSHDWNGNVFLNPPFKQPIVTHFVDKLLNELAAGHTEQAILLTDNRTDTDWWQKAASHSTAVCFTDGRISFYKVEGKGSSPTTGQTFCYFGDDAERFIAEFSSVG